MKAERISQIRVCFDDNFPFTALYIYPFDTIDRAKSAAGAIPHSQQQL
jgi:hypothetical protein